MIDFRFMANQFGCFPRAWSNANLKKNYDPWRQKVLSSMQVSETSKNTEKKFVDWKWH